MVEPGRRAAERLLARRARPDAIFCANDLIAVGALVALRDAHIDVPQDVAVVGMDNTALSELTWPALTTIDLGSAERARIAAELLFKRIDDPSRPPETVSVEPRLVVRASTGGERGMSAVQRERRRLLPTPGATRNQAGVELSGRESLFLLIPVLIPVVVLSVLPLVRGIYLGFTDSRAGLGVAHALHRARQLPPR